MAISKKDAIAMYGTQQSLADALGITRTAVTMWSDDKPIPREHELNLRFVLRPDLFTPPARQPRPASKDRAQAMTKGAA